MFMFGTQYPINDITSFFWRNFRWHIFWHSIPAQFHQWRVESRLSVQELFVCYWHTPLTGYTVLWNHHVLEIHFSSFRLEEVFYHPTVTNAVYSDRIASRIYSKEKGPITRQLKMRSWWTLKGPPWILSDNSVC